MIQTLLIAAALTVATNAAGASLVRDDFTWPVEPGVEIALREVVDPAAARRGDPVLLVHGARVPGLASFDLPVAGGSLAADLAAAGIRTYVVDLRGYGTSTRPSAMAEPPTTATPLVRSGAAARDLAAATAAIRERTGVDRVAILGWATGGHWAGLYATLEPEAVSRLVLYNTLYGYSPDHPTLGRGSRLADPDAPERFDLERFKTYRFSTGPSLLAGWDRSIPLDDKSAWRDPSVASAYVEAALASDPTSGEREPPSFRAPSGALFDSFLLATGAALWDARSVEADVLVIRSGADFWSRPEDMAMLADHLAQRTLGTVRSVTVPEATHFVHLDRPARGREAFLDAVIAFLAAPTD